MGIINAILSPIMAAMGFVLELAYRLVGSYGAAIVILALAVRLATAPIVKLARRAQERSRKVVQAMEPELAQIRATSTGRERFERTEEVYQRHDYHPIHSVTSLLPIFLQLPFLLSALFLLSDFPALAGQPFLFVPDLSRPDGLILLGDVTLNLLPILITAIPLLESRLSDANAGERARFLIIALVVAALIYAAPAAVCLYWLTTTLISLGGVLKSRMVKR